MYQTLCASLAPYASTTDSDLTEPLLLSRYATTHAYAGLRHILTRANVTDDADAVAASARHAVTDDVAASPSRLKTLPLPLWTPKFQNDKDTKLRAPPKRWEWQVLASVGEAGAAAGAAAGAGARTGRTAPKLRVKLHQAGAGGSDPSFVEIAVSMGTAPAWASLSPVTGHRYTPGGKAPAFEFECTADCTLYAIRLRPL